MTPIKLEPLPTPTSRNGTTLTSGLRGGRVGVGALGTYVMFSGNGARYLRLQKTAGRAPAGPGDAVPVSPDAVTAELNEKAARPSRPSGCMLVGLLGAAVVVVIIATESAALGFIAAIAAVVCAVLITKSYTERRITSLYYDIDSPALLERATLATAVGEALAHAKAAWLLGRGAHAGQRLPVTILRQGLPEIRANLELWGASAGSTRLFFLPDGLLVSEGKTFALWPYEQLAVRAAPVDVKGEGPQPNDAPVIRMGYRYEVRAGGPDLRYRDNPAIPVLRYGQVEIGLGSKPSMVLQTSNPQVAERVLVILSELRALSLPTPTGLSVPTPLSTVAALPATPMPARAAVPAPLPAAALPATPMPVRAAPLSAAALPATPMPVRAAVPAALPAAAPPAKASMRTVPMQVPSAGWQPGPQKAAPTSADRTPMQARAAAPAKAPARATWVPPGSTVQIGPWTLPGGMIYVGEALPLISPYRDEPALIVPSLPCAAPGSVPPAGFGYWPSYASLSPEQRGAYLRWLATGRSAPDVDMGCPFLLFQGLERRLLHDAESDPSVAAEAPALLGEVERLLAIYGPLSSSFLNYARAFVAFCRARYPSRAHYDAEPPLEAAHEVPTVVKLALGQLVVEGRPVPAGWALAWYLTSPESRLREPARRCPSEFRALFEGRYGEGIGIKPNKTLLRIEYRPASSAFAEPVTLSVQSGGVALPDVTRQERPLKQITEIAEACMDALDGYSRALGPTPTPEKRLRALAFLPPELAAFATAEGGPAAKLMAWLSGILSGDGLVRGADLIQAWLGVPEGKLSAKEARELSTVFEQLGVGLEPDPRFGGDAIKADSSVALFALPPGASAAPSGAYAFMSLWLRLAALVASSDGRVDPQEGALLEQRIAAAPDLDDTTRRRLRAQATLVLGNDLGTRGLAKRVEALPEETRARLAELAVLVAGADGRIEPAEVNMLSRIYKLLGLQGSRVFEDIHELQASNGPAAVSGPVRVAEAAPGPSGYAIPAQSGLNEASGAFTLDMTKVRRKEAESVAVSELLASIFVEPEDAPASSAEPSMLESADGAGAGAVASLLQVLAARAVWPRAEFDALAQRHGRMPSAALDAVNELAIEQTGDPVLVVEGDSVEVEPEILQELLAHV
jgi:tellurite resistance protein